MAEKDLYKSLGVSKGASDKEIREAYRKLARQYHPDRNPGDKRAEEKFKEISYAKDILTNKEKRKLYDEFGEVGLREGFNPEAYRQYAQYTSSSRPQWSNVPPGVSFNEVFFNNQEGWPEGLKDIFQNEIFGSVFRQARNQQGRRGRRSQDVLAEITISFAEALRGAEKELNYEIPGAAASCKNLRVRLPAGVKDGGMLSLKGQGINGGDLKLTVHVEGHRYFWREEDDLHLTLPITVSEAFYGATVEVPTIDGKVSLKIPRHTNSGAKLRIRGKGVHVKGQTRRGDLIAHVAIILPDAGDNEIGKAVKDLEKAYRENPRKELDL